MLKSKFSLSRHFEYANEQITYHFWLWFEQKFPAEVASLPNILKLVMTLKHNKFSQY
jgi:hypothetical protein